MPEEDRTRAILDYCLMALSNSTLKRHAFNALVIARFSHGLNYFRITSSALFNDLFADLHRVFDCSKDAASFWYIANVLPSEFFAAVTQTQADLARMKDIVNRE